MMQVQVLPLTLAPMDPLVELQLWQSHNNVCLSLLFLAYTHQSRMPFFLSFDQSYCRLVGNVKPLFSVCPLLLLQSTTVICHAITKSS